MPGFLTGPRLWDVVAGGYAHEIAPHFAKYGADALALAGAGAQSRVLDVACGPGAVALAAACIGARAFALDFSEGMISRLCKRAREEGVEVHAQLGDGTALPFGDASFDVVLCMFALPFFSDRGKGLRELVRVLKPGGAAVIGTWVAMERMPVLAEAYAVLGAALPDLPFGRADRPLCELGQLRDEMAAAGFRDIEAREITHSIEAISADGLWRAMQRSTPPIRAAQEALGEGWGDVHRRIGEMLSARWGEGPQRIPMTANLARGRR